MAKRDSDFDGTYENSRYGKQSLEEDLLDAGRGVITRELDDGGLYRQTDSRIDVWTPGSPGNYRHDFYNADTNEADSREGER